MALHTNEILTTCKNPWSFLLNMGILGYGLGGDEDLGIQCSFELQHVGILLRVDVVIGEHDWETIN